MSVNTHLEDVVRQCMSPLSTTTLNRSVAQDYIRDWGRAIRDAFVARNAHLTVPRGCSGGGNVGDVLSALSRSLSALQRSVSTTSEIAARSAREAKIGIAAIQHLLQPTGTGPTGVASATMHPTGSATSSAVVHHAAHSPPFVPATAGSPIGRGSRPLVSPDHSESVVLRGAEVAAGLGDLLAPNPAATVIEPVLGSLADLRDSASARPIADETAMTIVYDRLCRPRAGLGAAALSSQYTSRANQIVAAFKAMATSAELLMLSPPRSTATGTAVADGVNRDEGARFALLRSLDALIRRRLYTLLQAVGVTSPILLGKNPLSANSISDRILTINAKRKLASPVIDPLRSDESSLRVVFSPWRTQFESQTAAAASRPLTNLNPPGSVVRSRVASAAGHEIAPTALAPAQVASAAAPPAALAPATLVVASSPGSVRKRLRQSGPTSPAGAGGPSEPSDSASVALLSRMLGDSLGGSSEKYKS